MTFSGSDFMTKLLRDLPIGSKVKDITWEWEHRTGNNYTGSGKIKHVTWLVVAKNHDTYPNNSVTLLTHELIAKHCFDDSTDRGSDYGSNHWGNSGTTNADKGIRKFLNGSSYAGNDTNSYDKTFYDAFSKEFKDAILETTVQNKDYNGKSYTTKDKVFLPSQTEYGGGSSNTYPISVDYGYFSSDSSRIAKLNGEAQWYWTRSPNSGNADGVRGVNSDGSLTWDFAYNGLGVRPALNISSEILVSDSPDADGAYTIIHNKPPLISGEDKNLGDKNTPFTYTYQVSDPDGDAVSITEKINNTTIRNLSNAPQKQDLTVDISEKWSELAIDTEHTITITATDDKGNKSTRVIRFTKVNAPPIISGVDGFIGDKNMPFSYKYQVSDPDGDPIKVIERLNGIAINTRTNAPQDTDLTVDINKETLYTLPLNTMHTISIEASDDKGNTSYRNATFRRVNSAAIVESDAPNDFGEITDIPTISYQVSDPEGDAITVEELLDGEILRTVKNATPNQDMFVTIPQEKWLTIGLGQHTVKVRATDALGAYSEKTFKFTKVEDRIIVESKPIETEVMLAKIVPVVNAIVPSEYNMKFEACNNAFDDSPTWEDVTSEALQMQAYNFNNTEKTADKWGFAMRISILPEVV